MPRFDNYAQQLRLVEVQGSVSIDPASDAVLMSTINGDAIKAAASQDMSARTVFQILSAPSTTITVSSTAAKDYMNWSFPAVVHQCTIGASFTGGGTPGAAADIMRAENILSTSTSIIDGTTNANPVLILTVGSRSTVSSVANAQKLVGSGTLFASYVTRSSSVISGAMSTLEYSVIK